VAVIELASPGWMIIKPLGTKLLPSRGSVPSSWADRWIPPRHLDIISVTHQFYNQ